MSKKPDFDDKIATMSSVFQFRDYRKFLLEEMKTRDLKGGVSRLAEAAECQRSHISRVLAGQLQFTMDQAYRISKFLHLDENESDYFLKLVEWDRSGDLGFRKKIEMDLNSLLKKQGNLSERLKQESLDLQERQMLYYSSWHWSALHIIVSLKEYQTSEAIAARLGMGVDEVQSSLERLSAMKLVEKSGSKWKISSGSLHLSNQSPLNSVQHGNWRSRAVLDSQKLETDGLHYTVVQTISRSDFQMIKQKLLSFLDEYAKIAGPSKEEELICFAFDFFRV